MTPQAEENHRSKGLLRLTMACNERCTFCNVPAEHYRPQVHVPDDVLAATVQAFVRDGEQTLTISGGEPTLQRQRLLHWVRVARDGGIPFVELQTNAILIDRAYAGELAEAGVTSAFVSLLSHQPDLHDALTLVPGSHARCVRGIRALAEVGITVTLNPVFARATQHTLAAYVDWVGRELPVQTISMSFVQPHGRAASDLALLPDYGVVATQMPEAHAHAEAHGLKLVNPYCGLPLCVGWAEHRGASVEAIEAQEQLEAGPGLANQGNKHQGAPCGPCALRTRCGGAWHAYWQVHQGRGLAAPVQVVTPWDGRSPDASALVWWRTPDLRAPEPAGTTDVALDWTPSDRETLKQLRLRIRREAERPPQARMHYWVQVLDSDENATWTALQLAARVGVHGAWVESARLRRLCARLLPDLCVRGPV